MTFRNAVVCALALVLSGCASSGQTLAEQRDTQTREFDKATYETVFRAFKAVFQDEGYIIRGQDPKLGVITATLQRTEHGHEALWRAYGKIGESFDIGDTVEVSVNIVKTSLTIGVETRLAVQRIERYALGGTQGEELLAPEIYGHLYRKVALELDRRRSPARR